jgi:hypothetical protein
MTRADVDEGRWDALGEVDLAGENGGMAFNEAATALIDSLLALDSARTLLDDDVARDAHPTPRVPSLTAPVG